jgi:hypothetical protein
MSDPATPSWLTTDSNSNTRAPAEAASSPASDYAAGGSLAAPTGAATASVEPDAGELPGVILTMRLANMGVAAALIAISVSLSGATCQGRILFVPFLVALPLSQLEVPVLRET